MNPIRAEVVGPVSEELEARIVAYLKTIPECAQFPFMYFRVQSNDTFDRANHLNDAVAFLPIGNDPFPTMLVCSTGRGDGLYPIIGGFADGKLCAISIDFMSDADESF